MNVDTVPRTLAVAAAVSVACAAIVASAVALLRPLQIANALLERNRSIVTAAGLLPDGKPTDRDIVKRYLELEARVVNINTGAHQADIDARAYDHWQTLSQDAPAAAKNQPVALVPIYIVRQERALQRAVFPVHGSGMWSTIYGYLALEPDLNTIAGLSIFRHGETPGIGDRIEAASWLAQWRGKKLYSDDGTLRINVVKNADDVHDVDLISGASITSDAVGDMVRFWFGDDGYQPVLSALRQQEAAR